MRYGSSQTRVKNAMLRRPADVATDILEILPSEGRRRSWITGVWKDPSPDVGLMVGVDRIC